MNVFSSCVFLIERILIKRCFYLLIAYAHSAGPGLWKAVKSMQNRQKIEENDAKSNQKRSQLVQKSRKVGKNQLGRVVRRNVASRTLFLLKRRAPLVTFLPKTGFLEGPKMATWFFNLNEK